MNFFFFLLNILRNKNEFATTSLIIYKNKNYLIYYVLIAIISRFYFYFATIISRFRILITTFFSNYSTHFFSIKNRHIFIRLIRFHSTLIIITNSLNINKFFTSLKSSIFSIYIKIKTIFNTFLNFILNIKFT